jgi:tetratricopeptide (TPR) repeat protein
MLPPELSAQINSLVESRQIDSLVEVLQAADRSYPGDVEVKHLLGWARTQQGRYEEAIAHFYEAVRIKPDAAGSWNNLGHVLLELERVIEAVSAFKSAVTHQPTFVPALANLGFALARLHWYDKALPFLAEALRLDPNFIEARHHLAYVLMMLDRMEEADQQFNIVISQQPNNAGYNSTLGLFREKQHRAEEATALFLRAIELNPNLPEAWNNLGNVQAAVWGNWEQALSCFNRTLTIKPQYAEAIYHRGMVELTLGDFARGWADYEFRPTMAQKSGPRYRQPRWTGQPLAGKRILLHAEQGMGDTFQFIRYAQHIKALGATVLCEVQPQLIRILAHTPGIDTLIADGSEMLSHDFQIPLLSVAQILGVPAHQPPYLFADPARMAFWKERLAAIPGAKIGIAWQGEPHFKYDWLRSVPLAQFAPVARLPGHTLISLQKYHGVNQIAANRQTVPVVELQPEIDKEAGPFMDTAAIMMHLDLVITSDTSIAHLAGGLGVPVWLATQYAPDWRWMAGREDSIWYPSMRLFRQTQVNRWEDVFQRMANKLLAKQNSGPRPPAPGS